MFLIQLNVCDCYTSSVICKVHKLDVNFIVIINKIDQKIYYKKNILKQQSITEDDGKVKESKKTMDMIDLC